MTDTETTAFEEEFISKGKGVAPPCRQPWESSGQLGKQKERELGPVLTGQLGGKKEGESMTLSH